MSGQENILCLRFSAICALEFENLEARWGTKMEAGTLPRAGRGRGQIKVVAQRAGKEQERNAGSWGRWQAIKEDGYRPQHYRIRLAEMPAREVRRASRGYQCSRALSSWGQNNCLLDHLGSRIPQDVS